MAIFDILGNTLSDAYDVSGILSDVAYDVDGNTVYEKQTSNVDYSNYSYTQKWASKGIGSTQGFDIYDDKVFWVSKSGNSSIPSQCYVWNLSDGSAVLDPRYFTIYSGHGNNVTFSRTFYDSWDNFPLVLISTAYDNPSFLNRIENNYTATLLKKYQFPIIEDVISCGFDVCYGETDSIAYTASVFGSNSDPNLGTHICIAKWDIENATNIGDETYIPTLLGSVESAWHYWKQGIKYHDGLIWFASGYDNLRGYVYGIDPNTGKVKYTIDTETTSEIEGAVFYPDESVYGGYALYVGFAGMMLRKYTFGS